MPKKQPLLLGAHMSGAGGLEQAIVRGQAIGCTTIQLFTKSNRQWRARPLTTQEIELFKQTKKNSTIQSIAAHAAYLINIGSANSEVREKSVASLKQELERCQLLEIPYLIIHPGARGKNLEEQECLALIADNINQVLATTPGSTMLLLETMAGQGSNVCFSFEQLAQIIAQVKQKERIGVCLDTCHVFAAGYDLRSQEQYEHMWQQFDATVGLNYLKVIHVNDSKKKLGSRVDRHEHIGKGELGIEPFRLLFNDPRFFAIPKILETPKESDQEDIVNMQTIKDVINSKTKELIEI